MENPKIRVALWQPSAVLKKNADKLRDEEYEIVGKLQEQKIDSEYFDIVLIDYEGHSEKRKQLDELGVPREKIFTFEELWVKDSEEKITWKYHSMWEKLSETDYLCFRGSNVLIFGGGGGIGAECAYAFSQMGAEVVIAGRNEKKLKNICEYMKTKYIVWDITKVSDNSSKLKVCEELLTGKVDIVINCAGVWSNESFLDVTEETFDKILDANIKGLFFICQLFAKYFIENKIRGRIVNVLSNTGTLPTVKPYGISKWGGIGLTKGLGMHLAEYGIIVNGVAPGAVATEMSGWKKGDCPARRASKIGRLAYPAEIAHVILQLAGFIGDNMPGEVIVCDGGDKTISMRL